MPCSAACPLANLSPGPDFGAETGLSPSNKIDGTGSLNDAGSGRGLNDSGLGSDSGRTGLNGFCSSRGAIEGICGLGSGAETGAFPATEGAESDSFVASAVFGGSVGFLVVKRPTPL